MRGAMGLCHLLQRAARWTRHSRLNCHRGLLLCTLSSVMIWNTHSTTVVTMHHRRLNVCKFSFRLYDGLVRWLHSYSLSWETELNPSGEWIWQSFDISHTDDAKTASAWWLSGRSWILHQAGCKTPKQGQIKSVVCLFVCCCWQYIDTFCHTHFAKQYCANKSGKIWL